MSFRHVVAIAAVLLSTAAFAQTGAQTTPAASKPAATRLVAATSAMPPASTARVVKTDSQIKPGNAKIGQTRGAVCAACHGMDGNSTDPQYPRLAGQSERYIVRQLVLFKTGKRANPIMLGFASTLSPQDMRNVGAWFASQKPLTGIADDKLLKTGQSLYRAGDPARAIPACMACHGPAGSGNPGAPYPHLAGQHADYLQTTLKAWQNGITRGDDAQASIMPTIAKRLTDADISALASYLQGLHPANTRARTE